MPKLYIMVRLSFFFFFTAHKALTAGIMTEAKAVEERRLDSRQGGDRSFCHPGLMEQPQNALLPRRDGALHRRGQGPSALHEVRMLACR